MGAQTNYIGVADPRFPGVNNDLLQDSPIVAEVPQSMADDDTTAIQLPKTGTNYGPPVRVNVYTHTGGDITSAANATSALRAGDTLQLQIDDDGNGKFDDYTHTLGSGVTTGTAAQIAASINADTAINKKVAAVAGLTSNAVTLFPVTVRGAVRVVGGTAQAVLAFAGTADAKARTYASQSVSVIAGGTGWSWSYAASTAVLTVKNETGGAVARVRIVVQP